MKLEAIIERLQSRTWWNTFQERIEAVLDELGMFERAALVFEEHERLEGRSGGNGRRCGRISPNGRAW